MNLKYLILLAALVIVPLGTWTWLSWEPAPDPDSLAAIALSAGRDPGERRKAAHHLAALRGPYVVAQLRRLVAQSQDRDIQFIAIEGLATIYEPSNLPILLGAMDHQDPMIREVAYRAVLRIYGSDGLPENLEYRVDDPPAKRSQVTRRLREIYGQDQGNCKKCAPAK